jgi:glutathionylspermidine synthase
VVVSIIVQTVWRHSVLLIDWEIIVITSPNTAIEYYHELLSQPGEALALAEQLQAGFQAQNLVFGQRPICTVLRPCFLAKTAYQEVVTSAGYVLQGLTLLKNRLVNDANLRQELDLTPDEEAVVQLTVGYNAPDVSGRLDGFVSPAGDLNFVEYNADSPGGLGYGDALSDAFLATPLLQQFQQRYVCTAFPIRQMLVARMLAAYRRWGGRHLPQIAIVDWHGVSTYSEFVLIQDRLERAGCRVKIADPTELEYRQGKLWAGDFAIDLVYKRVIITELLTKYGLNHPLIAAVRDRNVAIINAFQVQMLYKKSCFALLSDPQYRDIFPPAVATALDRHIPWSRKVRESKTLYHDQTIDLLPFIAENRQKLVLKPNGEYGGKGVTLGWEVTAAEWQTTLKLALECSYIVQERIPLGQEVYPSLVAGELQFSERFLDLDPYVWDGQELGGCGVRLSQQALLNVSAGGGSATPLILIEES